MPRATDPLFLHRIDPQKNMARFYAMVLTPTLFGDVSLIRNWGRIGKRGRLRIDTFDDEAQAQEAMVLLATKKSRRGYRRPFTRSR